MRPLVLALMIFSAALLAQPPGPPDCQFTASFTAASPGTPISNKSSSTGGTPCVYWTFTYWTNGASGVAIKLEGAADVAGSPDSSYTALTSAPAGGNPAYGTQQGTANLCCDYYPWVRLNPITFTGASQSMIVRVYGWRTQQIAAGGSSGTANVNITEVGFAQLSLGQNTMANSLPVTVASDQSAIPVTVAANSSVNLSQVGGVSTDTNTNGDQGVINSCTSFAAITLTAAGNTQIVPLSTGKKIIVCSVMFATGTAENIYFTEGTGSNCGTGTASVTGVFPNILALTHDAMGEPYTATAGDALCLNQANAQALGGTIWYRYQ